MNGYGGHVRFELVWKEQRSAIEVTVVVSSGGRVNEIPPLSHIIKTNVNHVPKLLSNVMHWTSEFPLWNVFFNIGAETHFFDYRYLDILLKKLIHVFIFYCGIALCVIASQLALSLFKTQRVYFRWYFSSASAGSFFSFDWNSCLSTNCEFLCKTHYHQSSEIAFNMKILWVSSCRWKCVYSLGKMSLSQRWSQAWKLCLCFVSFKIHYNCMYSRLVLSKKRQLYFRFVCLFVCLLFVRYKLYKLTKWFHGKMSIVVCHCCKICSH